MREPDLQGLLKKRVESVNGGHGSLESGVRSDEQVVTHPNNMGQGDA